MKKILIFGAGKSATCLIEYLCKECDKNNWMLWVCDSDLAVAQAKIGDSKNARAISIDVSNDSKRKEIIREMDIVISMMPPYLHFLVANDCLHLGKHLLTASYIDENIQALARQIKEKGLLFLCEMGLDPGIDHMSAMNIINRIKKQGGKIVSFKSHCGGLVSPESDDNPWRYKITWNAANIVMAGSAGAVYKIDGVIKEIDYKNIFLDCKNIEVPGLSPLSWYPNRDSLNYLNTYGLNDIDTFIRTTLRYPCFCRGWNKIVNMGLTELDDEKEISNCKTYNEWYEFKKSRSGISVSNDEEFEEQVNYLGLQSNSEISVEKKNSAFVLQSILEKRLAINPEDKDMIVMLHEIEYETGNGKKEIRSCLIVKGEDQKRTAMAKTVGYPLGIAAKLILQDKIQLRGLHIPVASEIYNPVLEELEIYGIKFKEVTG